MDSKSVPNVPAANVTVLPIRSVWTMIARTVVIGVAFLLALTTARNSDVWAHLASGRVGFLWFKSIGMEFRPLSWLADVAMYLLFSALGGSGLVLAKSLLIAATAAVMLRSSTSWRTALGAFLAILALGGWLSLNPVCVSYLFLALTTTAIDRQSGDGESSGWRDVILSHWSLLICYTVWANSDVWCLLGVAIVGLHAVSRSLVRALSGDSLDSSRWRLFALVLAAVTLSFLPWYALSAARELANQVTNPEIGASPYQSAVFSLFGQGEFEGTVPLVAFWLLLVVGISSFFVATRSPTEEARCRAWERLIQWVTLFVATAVSVRFVPFFVVVCGVTIAQNFHAITMMYYRSITPAEARPWSLIERVRLVVQSLLSLLVVVVLLASVWAGGLQSLPSERRNWTVEPDPSLVRAAEEVRQWYSSGLLRADQETVFFANEAEDTFAWFAPQALVAGQSTERGPKGVTQIRTAILTPDRATALASNADVLLDPRVGCVVLFDPNRASFTAALRRMTSVSNEWKLAHLRGRVAVFARVGTGPAATPVDLSLRAFDLASADQAPADGSSQFAIAPHWSDPFLVARPPRSIDRDEAVTYLLYEEATRDHRMVNGAKRFLAILMASLVGSPPPALVGWVVDPRVTILTLAGDAVRSPSEGPPSIPFGQFAAFLILTDVSADHYLAIRAARRGVAASPRDAGAYEALGEAYLHLLSDPLEASWNQRFSALRQLRLIQTAAAFRQALALEPRLAMAHLGLATVYLERKFLDLAAIEFRAYMRFGRLQGQLATDAAERTRAIERTVESAHQTTEANAANLTVLDRARLAERNGLAGLALDTLLQSDVAEFGPAGIVMELDLLMAVGRVSEAREWLAPEHRNTIGILTHDWLTIQSAAAIGNYAGASAVLRSQTASALRSANLMSGKEFWAAAAITGKEVFIKRQNGLRMATVLLTSILSGFAASARQVQFEYQSKTEAYLLLALLALEEGDITVCSGYLESGRKLWEDVEKDGTRFPSPQRIILQQMTSLIRR